MVACSTSSRFCSQKYCRCLSASSAECRDRCRRDWCRCTCGAADRRSTRRSDHRTRVGDCGPFFGAMFNHTKDIPFAAAMMGAVYFLVRISRQLPSTRWSDVVGFGLLLGGATGLRALGLMLVGYAGVAVALAMPWARWRTQNGIPALALFSWHSGWRLVPALVLGYLIMIAAWPWGGAGAAQFAARRLFICAFPLRNPHHRRRRYLQDGGRPVVVRAGLCRDQIAAAGFERRGMRHHFRLLPATQDGRRGRRR